MVANKPPTRVPNVRRAPTPEAVDGVIPEQTTTADLRPKQVPRRRRLLAGELIERMEGGRRRKTI